MEFKCFPDAGALGLNVLDASIAINSSALPSFRAFSSGGIDSSGTPVLVDPDLAEVATGGFDQGSVPPGQPTPPLDNVFPIGQMDLVVRVSRVHGVWIDTLLASPSFVPPIVEPAAADQSAGTQVELAFRGATAAIPLVRSDASILDAYGDSSVVGAVTYLKGDASWKGDIAALDGARFLQVRVSFVSNAATGRVPRMTGLGIAFLEP